MQTVDLLVANAAFVGFFVFAVGCLVSGLMFAGFKPFMGDNPAGVAGSIVIIQKWCGIALFLSGFLVLLGSALDAVPGATGVSLWFGTILMFFGFLWLVLSDAISKGTDMKPVGVMLAFAGFILATYAFTVTKIISAYNVAFGGFPFWGQVGVGQYASGMFGDAFVLFVLAAVACFMGFIGIQFGKIVPWMLKYTGWMFFIIGLWSLYMSMRYIYELTMGGLGVGL